MVDGDKTTTDTASYEETYQELLSYKWKESKRLLDNNKFFILYYEKPFNWFNRHYLKALRELRIESIPIINESNMNIHSTQLREKIANNENVYPYINLGTQTYINQNHLYKL